MIIFISTQHLNIYFTILQLTSIQLNDMSFAIGQFYRFNHLALKNYSPVNC